MNEHLQVAELLSLFVEDDLAAEERRMVELHLERCADCRGDIEVLRVLKSRLEDSVAAPAAKRSPEHWNMFLKRVESEIAAAPLSGWKSRIRGFFQPSERLRNAAFSGTMGALVLLLIVLLSTRSSKNDRLPTNSTSRQTDLDSSVMLASDRKMSQYLRKSRVLLVGISNMDAQDGVGYDLSSERKAGEALIREARQLKQEPLDRRSAELIGDLEKILIELANMERNGDVPDVELLQTGIHQENLLFKIRMAEAVYDPSRR